MKHAGIDYYFIGLLSVIIAVIAFKWPHLGLPYFWDEAWVYGPAVLQMNESGLSILPDALSPDLTRGHPLLFHFVAALWTKVFGTGFFAVHSFALTISVAVLITVYFFGKSFFSPLVGLLSAIMLAVQPLFLAQSSFLLPEMMMALWTLLCLFYYLKNKWGLFVLFGTLMLLTKESGIVLLGVIGVWTFVESVALKKESLFNPGTLKIYLFIAIPFFISGTYFILQKLQYGWFFYPEHMGMLQFDWKIFHKKFLAIYSFLLQGQGRYLLFISFFLCVSFFWKSLSFFEKIFIPGGFVVTVFILFNIWNADDKITLFLLLVIFARLFQLVFIKLYNEDKIKGNALSVAALFAFVYFIFSQVNFLSLRYLTLLLPVIILIVFGSMHKILEAKTWLFVLLAFLCIGNCFRQITKYDRIGDADLSYVDAIKAQQKLVSYFEQNNLYEKKIYAGFNSGISLTDPKSGYLSSNKKFIHISDTITPDIEICLFTNIEPRVDYDSLLNEINLEKITSIEENKVWIDVYTFKGFAGDSLTHLSVSKRDLKITP